MPRRAARPRLVRKGLGARLFPDFLVERNAAKGARLAAGHKRQCLHRERDADGGARLVLCGHQVGQRARVGARPADSGALVAVTASPVVRLPEPAARFRDVRLVA